MSKLGDIAFLFLFFPAGSTMAGASPHVGTVVIKGSSYSQASTYLKHVEHCLTLLEESAQPIFGPNYQLKIEVLTIETGHRVAAGSASDREISLVGPPDMSTACHESFHVFNIQGWLSKKIKNRRASNGSTSPLFEAVPQLMAVLGAEDCLVGREGRFQLAYDHCRPLKWSEIPSLREILLRERHIGIQLGIAPEFWDRLLKITSKEKLAQASVYYSSIPMGHVLYWALPICSQETLLTSLISAFVEESFGNDVGFDSLKDFTPAFMRALERRAPIECSETVRRGFQQLEII